jgi:hypothetical protein
MNESRAIFSGGEAFFFFSSSGAPRADSGGKEEFTTYLLERERERKKVYICAYTLHFSSLPRNRLWKRRSTFGSARFLP